MIEEDNTISEKDEVIPEEGSKNRAVFRRMMSKSVATKRMSYVADSQDPEKKRSNWFVRSLKTVFKPLVSGISKVAGKIGAAMEYFNSTKLGKAYQSVTSNVVARAIGIVTCSLALAGISVFGAPMAASLAIAGIAAIGIKIAADTYQVRTVRRFEKENDLLIDNRTAKTIQDYLFKLEPELETILKNDLYKPVRENKKSEKERYSAGQSTWWIRTKAVLKTIFTNGIDATTTVVSAASGNVGGLVQAAGSTAVGLISESVEKVTIAGIKKKFRKQIDAERAKEDGPGYNNLRELKQEALKQDVQSRTLRMLVTDEGYLRMSDEEKLNKFKEIKEQILTKEKKLYSEESLLTRGLKETGSIIRDIGIAHNPFSHYNDSSKIDVKKNIALTEAMEMDRKKLEEHKQFNEEVNDAKSKMLKHSNTGVDVADNKPVRARSQSISR